MKDPVDYFSYEVRKEQERAIAIIDAMVAPTIEDAVSISHE